MIKLKCDEFEFKNFQKFNLNDYSNIFKCDLCNTCFNIIFVSTPEEGCIPLTSSSYQKYLINFCPMCGSRNTA